MESRILIPYAVGPDGIPVYSNDTRLADAATRAKIRIDATIARRADATPAYPCPGCGFHLYPKLSYRQRPHWSHFGKEGIARPECVFDQGAKKLTKDQFEALLYRGRQEGEAHRKLCETIAAMARADTTVINETIREGEYLKPMADSALRGRFPDIYFETKTQKFAIEVQLSPITLYRLVDRAEYYRTHNTHLIWVTREFAPDKFMRSWLWDMMALQGASIYALENDQCTDTDEAHPFRLRRFVYSSATGGWTSTITQLDDFTLVGDEIVKFKTEWWEAAASNWGDATGLLASFLDEYWHRQVGSKELHELAHTLNCLFCIEAWQPTGARVDNPVQIVHAFLNSQDGMFGWALIKSALQHYQPEALRRKSILDHLERAAARAQENGVKAWSRYDPIGDLRNIMFPDWTLPLAKKK